MKTLHELRDQLIAAQKMTGQSSYGRRAPASRSMLALLAVKAEIRVFVQAHPQDADAHRLLSMVYECLLSYPKARSSLEAALALSVRRDPKDLKRLALLSEYAIQWRALALSPEELAGLGRHLEQALSRQGCDHSLEQTRQWLAAHSPQKLEAKLKALRQRGGYCDCEVLDNMV